MTRGVKDSLVTLSALGAAGLLAYYSLSGPSAIIDGHPKSVMKRSFDGFTEEANDSASGYFSNFCFEDCEYDILDVAMFQDDGDDDDDDEDVGPDGRSKRKRKPKGDKQAASSGPDPEMIKWFNSQDGKKAIDDKVKILTKNIDKVHRQYPVAHPANLAPDAPQLGNGDSITSDASAAAMAAMDTDCSYGASGRVSDSAIFAIFPEDIMTASDVNQVQLHTSYVNFAKKMSDFTAGNSNKFNVGTYAANNVVNMEEYSSNFVSALKWESLNIPAKKNRQGSYNLAVTQPNIGKILGNVWKKAQKIVKRSMDSQPGSNTCQVFLFMHNLPFEYKTLAQGTFNVPNNIGARCNIMPVMMYNGMTEAAMMNIAARFSGTENQDWTTVEPHFRGWIGSHGNDMAGDSTAIADGLTSYSCMAEQRSGCLVGRSAWFESFDDEFRGVDEAALTTAATTTEGTTTTTGWTSTAPTDTTVLETEFEAIVNPDMKCCNVGGSNPVSVAGTSYDANEVSCCNNGGEWELC